MPASAAVQTLPRRRIKTLPPRSPANALEAYRRARRLSFRQLAESISATTGTFVSFNTVHRFCRGTVDPRDLTYDVFQRFLEHEAAAQQRDNGRRR